MKRPRRVWARLALAAAVLAVSPSLGQAQNRGPADPEGTAATGDPARRDIGVPATVPNLSGVWMPQTFFRTIRPADGGETPFLPWAKEFFLNRQAAEARGEPLFDPNANCLASGVPRVLSTPYPFDIVQTPNEIVIGIEVMHSFRIIHMDDRPMPPDYKPSYLGYSRGHWEGDVLVIETTGLNGYTMVDEEGRPKSNAMRVVEHWVKRAPDIIENTYTLYDDRTYSRPWSGRAVYKWQPELRFNEYICEENNRNKPDATGKLRKM